MKFSEQWLREWVSPELSTQDLAHQITMAGLEVDAIEAVVGEFSGVIVGEVLSAEQHPDADKLRVCQVSDGKAEFQVVCGAPNARAGIKVPFATVGAVLPGDFKIKKAKLRGVESFGMLCGPDELGLGESTGGLLELSATLAAGQDLREALDLNDQLIELGLTPNRSDCLSLRGIARDVAVLNEMSISEPDCSAVAPACDALVDIDIKAVDDCPRYVGRVIRNIDISRPSPSWLQEKLRRAGLRSIDAVVDVTNYILLELGQPLHGFDLAKLSGGICVRLATEGEKLTLLDGQELALRADSMVIADQEKALALAGIMGGKESSVTDQTRDIFLESAFFAPEKLAGRARSYGLHTDSSHRFERGVDYNLPMKAIERATRLIVEIVGGEPGPVAERTTAALPEPNHISLREARIEKMLGMPVAPERVESILEGLGLTVNRADGGWSVSNPSWRFDLEIEVDLLEELARIVGYNNLPVKPITDSLTIQAKPEAGIGVGELRRRMTSLGYQEAITYSFVDPAWQKALFPATAAVSLINPISADLADMRVSHWPGLLKAVSHNLNRQQPRVRLFETGLCFLPDDAGNLKQEATLSAVITGSRSAESWHEKGVGVDFYDAKGDLESLLNLSAGKEFRFAADEHPALHPGQSAAIFLDGEKVGVIGALHPSLVQQLDLGQSVYLFEIALSAITDRQVPSFKTPSRYPEVRRDLAVLIDRATPAQDLLDVTRSVAGSYLANLKLFDIYEGEGIDPQRKSLALGLTYRHSSRTLTEEEVNESIANVVRALEERFGATLRN
ncbi:MAG TPA: phenylalanine--tRNA ligase subunit beta [Spongiibacteraceae bacterium]|nr:phenylalanine--tRNA ligase subunit beta [Spongiibacteraceae bacterium]HCS29225.1 phenylalanine--tRNA ligase subunit beta [Spongiibacteraceae bacterium]